MLCIDYSMRSMLQPILRFSTSKVHFLWKENSDGTSFHTDQLVSLLSEQRLVHASHPIKTHEYCSFPKTQFLTLFNFPCVLCIFSSTLQLLTLISELFSCLIRLFRPYRCFNLIAVIYRRKLMIINSRLVRTFPAW